MQWWGDNIMQTLKFYVFLIFKVLANEQILTWLSLKKSFMILDEKKRRIFAALAPHNLRLSVYRCRSVETVKLLHENRASALRLHEYRVSALRISQGRTVNIWLAGLPECQLEKSYDPRESALSCGNLNKPSYFPKSWSLRRPHACCKYSDVIQVLEKKYKLSYRTQAGSSNTLKTVPMYCNLLAL